MLNALFGISAAMAETTTSTSTSMDASSLISMLLSMVVIVVVFYFILIRPQRKKDKKVKEMLDALKPGDRVCTIGGIYGTIASIKDDTITLLVGGEKTEMVMARWGIRNVEEVKVENDGEILA